MTITHRTSRILSDVGPVSGAWARCGKQLYGVGACDLCRCLDYKWQAYGNGGCETKMKLHCTGPEMDRLVTGLRPQIRAKTRSFEEGRGGDYPTLISFSENARLLVQKRRKFWTFGNRDEYRRLMQRLCRLKPIAAETPMVRYHRCTQGEAHLYGKERDV